MPSIRVEAVEAPEGGAPGFGEGDPAVAIKVEQGEGAAAETGHHCAAAAATGEAPARALSALAPHGAGRLELGAADHFVMVGIELLEPLPAPLASALLPLLATGLGPGFDLVPGDEAVAIGIGSGEAGFDLGLNGRAGLRLGETAAALAVRLGRSGRRGERRQSRAGKE